MSDVTLCHSLPLFFEVDSVLNLRLLLRACLASERPASAFLCPPVLGLQILSTMHSFYSSLRVCSKHFAQ